jgi:hypothetical protein
MQDRRGIPEDTLISAELYQKGTTQLENEIKILEGWLAELDETRGDNPFSVAARISYGDMLQSRRDLLKSLQKHRQSSPSHQS